MVFFFYFIVRSCEMLEGEEVSAFSSLGTWSTLSWTREEEPQKSTVNIGVYRVCVRVRSAEVVSLSNPINGERECYAATF